MAPREGNVTTTSYVAADAAGNMHSLPRRVDPATDLSSVMARLPQRWDPSGPPWTSDELGDEIERRTPREIIERIDSTLREAERLAEQGLAEAPPADRADWRRSLVLSWNHAQDLVALLAAMQYPARPGLAMHDLEDWIRAKWLRTRMDSCSDWYRRWVDSCAPDELVNVGFLNPHLCASLYSWGEDHLGTQNAMDAHRLAAHHLGNPDASLDWIERAANFVFHHLPREHFGIRHEPLADWPELDARLENDPAIRNQPIGKLIARDAATILQALEQHGRVTPWHRLARHPGDASHEEPA